VRFAVGAKRLSDRGRRSLQPAPIASEIEPTIAWPFVLFSNNWQTLRLLSNSLARWLWNLFDRSLNAVLTIADARRQIQLIARFTAFRNLGSTSSSNQRFFLIHIIVRQLGCGSGKYMGPYSANALTVSVIERFAVRPR
jgi:hypothetical protein